MPRERNAYKLGLVLIIMAIVFVAVMIFIPSLLPSGKTRPLRIRFSSALPLPPLETGSKVLLGGQNVGAVSEIALEEQAQAPKPGAASQPAKRILFIVVTALIHRDVPLHPDCRVVPEGPPLGGPGQLLLTAGTAIGPLPDGQIIEGDPPAGFAAAIDTLNHTVGVELDGNDPNSLLGMIKHQLDAGSNGSLVFKLQRSMDDFNAMTASVRGQLDAQQRDAVMAKLSSVMDNLNATTAELRRQMDASRSDVMLAKINSALDTLNSGMAMINSTVRDSRGPINDTLVHVAHTAETLDTRVMKNLAEQTDVRNAASLMAKIHDATDQLNLTLKNITEVSGTAREVAVLNRDNVNETLRNLKQTSEQVKSAIKFVLRRPWLLFNPPPPSQTRQEDIFDAARSFAEAAAHLDDATSDLRAVSELHNGQIPTNDPDFVRVRGELKESFQKFREAEASLWKQLDVK